MWPENTMLAFESAISLGAEHLETDIRVSTDGIVFCLHDQTVNRTTDGFGSISAHTADEIVRLDAGYRHRQETSYPYRGKGATIPTFEELAFSFPDARIVVDLKEDSVVAPFAALATRTGLGSRLIVGSFSDSRIERFRALTNGTIATSTGARSSRRWLVNSRVGKPGGGQPSALQLPMQLRGLRVIDQKLVDVAHAAGLQVHVWTVNDPDQVRRLFEMGVDAVVTDRPDLMIGDA